MTADRKTPWMWSAFAVVCLACSEEQSTSQGAPSAASGSATGGGMASGGAGGLGGVGPGANSGTAGGISGSGGACTSAADCGGGSCCDDGAGDPACVASVGECAGLILCRLPQECPKDEICCPQGFCGGCD